MELLSVLVDKVIKLLPQATTAIHGRPEPIFMALTAPMVK